LRYCYKKAGVDFLSPKVSVSNTDPEHIAQARMKADMLIRYKP